MSGESNLSKLLSNLSPALLAGEFVFLSFRGSHYGDHADLEPIASVMECEGLTLVIPRQKAEEHGFEYESAFRAITLNVHSSLEAVGLTAAISSKLSEYGVSANVIAGYFHDHIFVPNTLAEQAVVAINELSRPRDE
ncbi:MULTISPECIES: ACT domain-containing protein [unclassified Lentimonas]|uniref:ACT domain-containing protein n=1 Tax=unclassified Lentimonas TaxID=2630993 RepID=UPI001326BC38|nr:MULTISPECIES: ACT domain-containing protein [unclassified Lentimonas]CAA6680108.1 Unannotated [Lentimonas sp. CC4]CAA6685088.1 Unannotated [Lentimonas sp. CC6]CAA6693189.1 Unannotated [Lentimonas sp. CC19]CAA6697603.1 Unannotated [Lentimonas sp. CC10]CAA7068929.1 Unannotated [Lentimonas sp. CC11]